MRNDRFRPDGFTGCMALLAGTLATARLMNAPGRDLDAAWGVALAGLAGFATVWIGFQAGASASASTSRRTCWGCPP